MSKEYYKASMKARRLVTKDLGPAIEKIDSKVTEINNQLKAIEQRIRGIQEQLTDIEGKLPVKQKA